MTVTWTTETVLTLAPDPASAKAGQGLASARKWASLGSGEGLIWGECQGSGASPYQTKCDLSGPAFSCSCPSRKFPCKHGLGLMLIWASAATALRRGCAAGVGRLLEREPREEGREGEGENRAGGDARQSRRAGESRGGPDRQGRRRAR